MNQYPSFLSSSPLLDRKHYYSSPLSPRFPTLAVIKEESFQFNSNEIVNNNSISVDRRNSVIDSGISTNRRSSLSSDAVSFIPQLQKHIKQQQQQQTSSIPILKKRKITIKLPLESMPSSTSTLVTSESLPLNRSKIIRTPIPLHLLPTITNFYYEAGPIITSRDQHEDELKLNVLPNTLEIYLPGKNSWDSPLDFYSIPLTSTSDLNELQSLPSIHTSSLFSHLAHQTPSLYPQSRSSTNTPPFSPLPLLQLQSHSHLRVSSNTPNVNDTNRNDEGRGESNESISKELILEHFPGEVGNLYKRRRTITSIESGKQEEEKLLRTKRNFSLPSSNSKIIISPTKSSSSISPTSNKSFSSSSESSTSTSYINPILQSPITPISLKTNPIITSIQSPTTPTTRRNQNSLTSPSFIFSTIVKPRLRLSPKLNKSIGTTTNNNSSTSSSKNESIGSVEFDPETGGPGSLMIDSSSNSSCGLDSPIKNSFGSTSSGDRSNLNSPSKLVDSFQSSSPLRFPSSTLSTSTSIPTTTSTPTENKLLFPLQNINLPLLPPPTNSTLEMNSPGKDNVRGFKFPVIKRRRSQSSPLFNIRPSVNIFNPPINDDSVDSESNSEETFNSSSTTSGKEENFLPTLISDNNPISPSTLSPIRSIPLFKSQHRMETSEEDGIEIFKLNEKVKELEKELIISRRIQKELESKEKECTLLYSQGKEKVIRLEGEIIGLEKRLNTLDEYLANSSRAQIKLESELSTSKIEKSQLQEVITSFKFQLKQSELKFNSCQLQLLNYNSNFTSSREATSSPSNSSTSEERFKSILMERDQLSFSSKKNPDLIISLDDLESEDNTIESLLSSDSSRLDGDAVNLLTKKLSDSSISSTSPPPPPSSSTIIYYDSQLRPPSNSHSHSHQFL